MQEEKLDKMVEKIEEAEELAADLEEALVELEEDEDEGEGEGEGEDEEFELFDVEKALAELEQWGFAEDFEQEVHGGTIRFSLNPTELRHAFELGKVTEHDVYVFYQVAQAIFYS